MEHHKGARIIAIAPQGRELSYIRENINVVVEEIPRRITLNEYVDLQVQVLKRLKGITVLERIDTFIAGERAVRFSYSYSINDFGYRAIVHTMQRHRSFFVITGISQINNYNNFKKIFLASAASFRFE